MNGQAKLVIVGVGVGLVALLAVAYFGRKALAKAAEAVDITSDKNLASQGAGAVVQAITGGADQGGEDSVGGVFARLREWVSGDDAKIRDMLKVEPPKNLTDGAI